MYRELHEIIINLKSAKTVGEEQLLLEETEKLLEKITHCCSKEKLKVQSLISSYNLGATLVSEVITNGLEPLLKSLVPKEGLQ